MTNKQLKKTSDYNFQKGKFFFRDDDDEWEKNRYDG